MNGGLVVVHYAELGGVPFGPPSSVSCLRFFHAVWLRVPQRARYVMP